ncbi:uncharacterized protein RCC_03248 [Ramularia collo-cygni]|uniref:F-box domain-containing protein n=1 Tax=Ramularia collo-cygni TaxID=112498 RepID=A0A2D3V4K3_9PEZI|nr:uncharacterized protein RCC_03248 [Ramularia collo-cygni]CZT17414.1 uncharacterized protein RCC_03248 [Ramularia collo-cygni]
MSTPNAATTHITEAPSSGTNDTTHITNPSPSKSTESPPLSSDATPSATSRVLQTTELLEAILLNLPMQQILLSQRTCKTFQDTVRGSLSLQRKIHFAPVKDEGQQPVVNPFLDYYRSKDPISRRGWQGDRL